MFDSSLELFFVQKNRNKIDFKGAIEQYIYKFFIPLKNGNYQKYILQFTLFEDDLLIINFYPKIKSDNKFKLLTNHYRFGRVVSAVFIGMEQVTRMININTFGMLCAITLDEEADNSMELNEGTKRFKVYRKILSRKIDDETHTLLSNEEDNLIFIIPNDRNFQKMQ